MFQFISSTGSSQIEQITYQVSATFGNGGSLTGSFNLGVLTNDGTEEISSFNLTFSNPGNPQLGSGFYLVSAINNGQNSNVNGYYLVSPENFIFVRDALGNELSIQLNSPLLKSNTASIYNIEFNPYTGVPVYDSVTNYSTQWTVTPTKDVQPYKSDGCNCSSADPGIADPIRIGTGNLFEEVDDYKTVGANALAFTRSYNSLGLSHLAGMTANWMSTYDRRLYIESASTVYSVRQDGQILQFGLGGTAWSSDSDIDLKLIQAGSNWILTNSDDNVETYNSSGLLVSIQARDQYIQFLQYDANNILRSVTDSFGRKLQFRLPRRA